MRFYLAQSMMGYSGQSEFTSQLKTTLRSGGHIVDDPYEFEFQKGWTDAFLVEHDLNLVDKCDILIAYLQRPSNGGGTYGEFYRAAWSGKPIIFVAPTEMHGPWMRYHISAHVDTNITTEVKDQVNTVLALIERTERKKPAIIMEKHRL